MTDLRGADLSGFDLRGADLTGADLTDADLRGADLRGARLFRATLTGALLEGATLEGADFEGSDMRGSGLEPAESADREPARRERSGGIRPSVVLAAAIALAVGVGGALAIPALMGGGDDAMPSAALEYRPSSSHSAAADAQRAEADASAVTLRAVGTGSWVEVRERDESGDVLFRGLLDPGDRKHWSDPGTLWMRVGAPSGLRVTSGGTERALAGATGDFLVARAGVSRL